EHPGTWDRIDSRALEARIHGVDQGTGGQLDWHPRKYARCKPFVVTDRLQRRAVHGDRVVLDPDVLEASGFGDGMVLGARIGGNLHRMGNVFVPLQKGVSAGEANDGPPGPRGSLGEGASALVSR